MSFLDITQQALEAAMSGSMQRQTLLTNNLANADTPGFQPQDVNFQQTLANALQQGQPLGQVKFQPYSAPQTNGPDGNGVDANRRTPRSPRTACSTRSSPTSRRPARGWYSTAIDTSSA